MKLNINNNPKTENKNQVNNPANAAGLVKLEGSEYTVKGDDGKDVVFASYVPAGLTAPEDAIAEEVVDEEVTQTAQTAQKEDVLPAVTFSTYRTKKGDTAPQIIGFAGEDDPRWKRHKDAKSKCVSASYRRDLNGEKVYILMFGVRYMDVAKALAGAYNTDDQAAWARAESAVTAIYEQAQRDGKARWEAKKAEWAQKKAEREAAKAQPKTYTEAEVAAMIAQKQAELAALLKAYANEDADATKKVEELLAA